MPWRIVEDFVSEQPQSCLARVLPRMQQLRTYAEDTTLSPWITWPTVHRGVCDEVHTISDFGQELRAINDAYPSVWEILVRHGITTGVCGSLHSYPPPPNVHDYAFYIPDVYAAGSECFPRRIESFQAFNLEMTRASARNVSTRLPWQKVLRFLADAPSLGLKPHTVLDVGMQMMDERREKWMRVRRRTYQVVLAFDIFMKQLALTRPAFATFFTNHVASSMHRYWAARYPDDYPQFSYTGAWVETYRHEIAWTMSKFDSMLERLVRFVHRHPGYALWVATSMGQAATQASEAQTQVYLTDVPTFMRRLGFAPTDWETRPAMLPRVIIVMNDGRAAEFERRLQGIEVANHGPLPWKRLAHDVFRLHPGVLQNVREQFCRVDGAVVPFAEVGFRNVEIEDSAGQSAYHIPRGALLVYDATSTEPSPARAEISTVDIAPMILNNFGVPLPSYMRHPRR